MTPRWEKVFSVAVGGVGGRGGEGLCAFVRVCVCVWPRWRAAHAQSYLHRMKISKQISMKSSPLRSSPLRSSPLRELSTQKLSTQKLSTQKLSTQKLSHSEGSRMHTPAIGTVSPVFGFRPSRAALSLESKVPNPTSDTLSPLATDSTITSRAARTRVGGGMNRFVVFVLLLEDVSVDASRSRRTPAPTSPPATHPPSPPWKRQLLLPTWGNRG